MLNEGQQEIERIGGGRKKLLALERNGEYVFHGSPDIIDKLEPRQAFAHNEETGQYEKDRNPVVFATPYADFAIFRSLINDPAFENGCRFKNGKLYFYVDKELLEKVKDKVGKVYVLDRSKFKDFIGMECISDHTISPTQVINVTVNDLSPDIKIHD